MNSIPSNSPLNQESSWDFQKNEKNNSILFLSAKLFNEDSVLNILPKELVLEILKIKTLSLLEDLERLYSMMNKMENVSMSFSPPPLKPPKFPDYDFIKPEIIVPKKHNIDYRLFNEYINTNINFDEINIEILKANIKNKKPSICETLHNFKFEIEPFKLDFEIETLKFEFENKLSDIDISKLIIKEKKEEEPKENCHIQ